MQPWVIGRAASSSAWPTLIRMRTRFRGALPLVLEKTCKTEHEEKENEDEGIPGLS
jgi:hypothetical protein